MLPWGQALLLALLLTCGMNATAGTLWTPASPGAPALDLWFDGADASTLSTASSSPGKVIAWRDKSGNGRDATADVSYAPSLTSLNGNSALDFGSFVFSTANPHMYFPVVQANTVFKVWGSAQGGMFFMTNRDNYSWHRGVRLNDETNPANAIFEVDNSYSEPNVRSGDAITRLNGSVVDPTNIGLSGDWDIVDNRAATGSSFPTDTLALDRTFRTGGEGIAEVIVLTGRPSEYDVRRIEGYLAWKWGLQGKLPVGHPYKSQAPMVTNLLANGGFEAGTLADTSFTYRPTDQGPWVFFGDAGDETFDSPISNLGTPAPPEGRIAAFVQIQGYLEQTFTAATASTYSLTFDIAQRQYAGRQTLSILIDGVEVYQVQGPTYASWHAVRSPPFTLSAGTHTIRFAGLATDDSTAFIDDVVLAESGPAVPAQLVAYLRLDETAWNGTTGEAADSNGSSHPGTGVGSPFPAPSMASPAKPGLNGTCGYAQFAQNGAFDVPNLPVSTVDGDQTSVSFWMQWDGTDSIMPIGWANQDLWFKAGDFGFNSAVSDIYGIPSAGLANGWHHVVAIFVNGDVPSNVLYIDGVKQALSQRQNSPYAPNAVVGSTLRISGWTRDGGFRFSGALDEFRIYRGAMTDAQVASDFNAGHACPGVTLPGSFNAFEATTAAGSIIGFIHTKVSGSTFGVDVVALDAPRSAVMTGFTGDVLVEILNATDNSGALDGNACRSSWAAVPSGASAVVTFGSGDGGRKSVMLAEPEAWRNARLRITSPATGAPVNQACSTDPFAIRPSALAGFAASDGDAQSTGTARSLSNTSASGGVVHKAGRPFTLKANAVNGGGATTARYDGTASPVVTLCSGSACPGAWTTIAGEDGSFTVSGTRTVRYGADVRWSYGSFNGSGGCNNSVFGDPAYSTAKTCQISNLVDITGTVSAVGGVIASNVTYGEAGSVSLQLLDTTFTAIDATDGSSLAERTIASPVVAVGRFVPDHFDIVALSPPMLKTFDSTACGARSFTYMGQPFGYTNLAQATVTARNAAGNTTRLYSDALWKLTGPNVAQTFVVPTVTPPLDASLTLPPVLTSNGDGSGLLVGVSTDKLRYTRPTTPSAPFAANIAMSWNANDASEAGVSGNGTVATPVPLVFSSIAFDAGNQMRFGVLRLTPAYGSELLRLPVPVEAQYWDGQRMATNTADQCTVVPSIAVSMGNYQRSLAACKTALDAGDTALAAGRGTLRLAKPGAGNYGSVDVSVQLGASATGQTCAAVNGSSAATTAANLGWLQGRWGSATAFDQNPSTRASFGQYRSPMIYQRENF